MVGESPYISLRMHLPAVSPSRHRPAFRSKAGARGFTLIEVMAALFIFSLIIGIAILSIRSVSAEQKMRDTTEVLKQYAKEARRLAIEEQRPWAVEFRPGRFMLTDMSMGGDAEEESSIRYTEDDEEEAAGVGKVERTHDFSAHANIGVQRFHEKDVRPIDKRVPEIWRFEPSGLCEPIVIRFTNEDGFFEMEFNPLDAHVVREEYSL